MIEMDTRAESIGGFVGVLLVLLLGGWLAFDHFTTTVNDRLPLKARQELARIQDKLPIEVRPNIFLDQIKATKYALKIVMRNKKIDKAHDDPEAQALAEMATQIWLCEWRKSFLDTADMKIDLSLNDKMHREVLSVTNTFDECRKPRTLTPPKPDA